jgi:hypothetical protein
LQGVGTAAGAVPAGGGDLARTKPEVEAERLQLIGAASPTK